LSLKYTIASTAGKDSVVHGVLLPVTREAPAATMMISSQALFTDKRCFSSSAYSHRSSSAGSATELAGLVVNMTEENAVAGPALPVSGLGPLNAYQEGLAEGILRKDPLQEATIHNLQRLYDEIVKVYPPTTKERRSGSGITLLEAQVVPEANSQPWWSTLFSSVGPDPDDPEAKKGPKIKGLYMFGGVGCGKTMLMDFFAACSPADFMASFFFFFGGGSSVRLLVCCCCPF